MFECSICESLLGRKRRPIRAFGNVIGYTLIPVQSVGTKTRKLTPISRLCPCVRPASILPSRCPEAAVAAVLPAVEAASAAGRAASGSPCVASAAPPLDSLAAWQPHGDPASEPRMSSVERSSCRVERLASPQSETWEASPWPARRYPLRVDHPPGCFPAFVAVGEIVRHLAPAERAFVALPGLPAGNAVGCPCSCSHRQEARRP